MWKATAVLETHLNASQSIYFQTFPGGGGGACPQTPLWTAVLCMAIPYLAIVQNFPTPAKIPVWNPGMRSQERFYHIDLHRSLTWRCDSNKSVNKVVCLPKYIHHSDVEGVRRSTEVEHIDGLWQCTCVYKAVNWSAQPTLRLCSLNLRQKDTYVGLSESIL